MDWKEILKPTWNKLLVLFSIEIIFNIISAAPFILKNNSLIGFSNNASLILFLPHRILMYLIGVSWANILSVFILIYHYIIACLIVYLYIKLKRRK